MSIKASVTTTEAFIFTFTKFTMHIMKKKEL